MPRLLREEAKARTRARLIAAAEKVFADKGFAAASLEEIAESAGFSRGALYYNFADKDELFVAVLIARIDAQIAEISGLQAASTDPPQFVDALRARADRRRSSADARRWALLADEFWLYAVRNPPARAKLAEHYRHLRAAYVVGITATMHQLGITPPAPPEHLAALLVAMDASLPRQQWLDPDALPQGLFFDLLSVLVEASVALDHERKASKRARPSSPRARR